uniref:Transmembrane protein n=1 Tax=Heterorhabditis bacteriophora TaxID=37862 RepID=A0A1I7WMY8_HETBA
MGKWGVDIGGTLFLKVAIDAASCSMHSSTNQMKAVEMGLILRFVHLQTFDLAPKGSLIKTTNPQQSITGADNGSTRNQSDAMSLFMLSFSVYVIILSS